MKIKIFKFAVLFSCTLMASQAYSQQKRCLLSETYYSKSESFQTSRVNNQDFGELSVVVNSLSRTPDGEKVGTAISRRIHLGLDSLTPAPHAMYETSATIILPEGTFTSLSVSDYEKDRVTKVIERPVMGGTGKYAGARGVVRLEPIDVGGKVRHKGTVQVEVFCD